jgi:hypothetical protein
MALREYAPTVPPARALLRNLLAYACATAARDCGNLKPPAKMLYNNETASAFLAQVGAAGKPAAHPGGVVVLDPGKLNEERIGSLHLFLVSGGQVLVLPARPEHVSVLSALAGVDVRVEDAPAYQLAPGGHELARGISVSDLYHLERVTYTPANQHNRLAAQHSLEIEGRPRLFEGVHNPWEAFFTQGMDGEYQKIAVATRILRTPFTPRGYGAVAPVGAGRLVFCQLLPEAGNAKVVRVYARLLGNLGAALEAGLFSTVRGAKDFAIDALMALPREYYQDLGAMEAYFSAPGYVLNNLGEGVYGWMKRAERKNGAVEIPGSAGRTWFLSVFVESEINRDPERRAAGELPDSSIVPDLFLEANCACRVYINGRRIFCSQEQTQEAVKIDDVPLVKGTNRVALVCAAGAEDVRLNLWFLNKYGDPLEGLRYRLTLD